MQDPDKQDWPGAPQHDSGAKGFKKLPSIIATFRPEKLYKRPVMAAAILAAAVAAIIVLIVCVYAFVIRVPDDEYDKAITTVQSMSAHASKMAEYDRIRGNQNTGDALSEVQVTAVKAETDSYVNLLLQLQDSPVIKRDAKVKATYNANRQRIDEYGTSSALLYDTLSIYSEVTKRCSDLSRRIDEPKTVADFDKLAASCKDYATQYKTVPIKGFSDEVYVKYRKATLAFVTAARKYYVASNSKSTSRSSVQRAMTTMDNAQTAMQKAGSGGDKYLKNTQNSGDQLSILLEVIEERKEVLLR